MADMNAAGRVKQFSVEAVVIRCACGNPASHLDALCPVGVVEDHGTVSYYHRNPLMRLRYWWLRRRNKAARFWNGGETI
jgi:hypothetical protein